MRFSLLFVLLIAATTQAQAQSGTTHEWVVISDDGVERQHRMFPPGSPPTAAQARNVGEAVSRQAGPGGVTYRRRSQLAPRSQLPATLPPLQAIPIETDVTVPRSHIGRGLRAAARASPALVVAAGVYDLFLADGIRYDGNLDDWRITDTTTGEPETRRVITQKSNNSIGLLCWQSAPQLGSVWDSEGQIASAIGAVCAPGQATGQTTGGQTCVWKPVRIVDTRTISIESETTSGGYCAGSQFLRHQAEERCPGGAPPRPDGLCDISYERAALDPEMEAITDDAPDDRLIEADDFIVEGNWAQSESADTWPANVATPQGQLLAEASVEVSTTTDNQDGTYTTRVENVRNVENVTNITNVTTTTTVVTTSSSSTRDLVSETTSTSPPPSPAPTVAPTPAPTPGPTVAPTAAPTPVPSDVTFEDNEFPDVPELYEQKYPDGLVGVWQEKWPELQATEFIQGVQEMIPDLEGGGSCPAFQFEFNWFSVAQWGTFDLEFPCALIQVAALILLISATFVAWGIIFGIK